MNKMKRYGLIILTIFCIGIGFLLPHQIAIYQDGKLKKQVINYKMNKVEFKSTSTFENVLDVFSKEYNILEQKKKNTKHTEKQILKIVRRFLTDAEKKEILHGNPKIVNQLITPMLAVASAETVCFANIWEYIGVDKSKNSYRILVDDLTGKLLQFEVYYAYTAWEFRAKGSQIAEKFCSFLQPYFEEYEISYDELTEYSDKGKSSTSSADEQTNRKKMNSSALDDSTRVMEELYCFCFTNAREESFTATFEVVMDSISFYFSSN